MPISSLHEYASAPSVRGLLKGQRRSLRDIRQPVGNDEPELFILPRQALRNRSRTGADTQIRWPVRRRGGVSPGRADTSSAAGEWILRATCAEAALWTSGVIGVNVAAGQIDDGLLHSQVAAALDASGLDPERLELALPEPALAALDDDALLVFAALRDLGVGLALDDFGAGACSFSLLRRLPISVLKLSRSLVRGLTVEPGDDAIVRAIVSTAHALGLSVIADGVETAAQNKFLLACGCDEGQGLYFGTPVRARRAHPNVSPPAQMSR